MTPLPTQIVSCPTCAGNGVTTNPQGTLSCLQCGGTGMWLETESGQKLTFGIPAIESPHHAKDYPYLTWLRYGATGISLLTLVGSTGYLLVHNPLNFSGFFWQQGLPNGLFAVSGLASAWLVPLIHRNQTSDKSLHNLTDDLASLPSGSGLDLGAYANERVKEIFALSAQTAEAAHTTVVDETVLLIALLDQPRIRGVIARLELSITQMAADLKAWLPEPSTNLVPSVTFTPGVRQRLYAAFQEASTHEFPYIDLEDILLTYASSDGPYKDFLKNYGLDYKELYAVTRWYAADQERTRQWAFWKERGRSRPKGFMNRAWTALPTRFLDQFSVDITRIAATGNLPAATVRKTEIDQILQVLGRTQKNNVLLVGEPGVGKSVMVGAIALRMIEENVPEILKDKRLVSMDMAALLGNEGGAEHNIQKVIDEVAQAGNVILAIPDIHVLVGTSGGALDAATLLSNALNRGYLQVITTATYADYHRYIESNPTFASLLEIVEIKEVSVEQAIEILEEEAPQIEARQDVWLTYPAIETAATLAKRYFPDRALPDSAIGLLDEAASSVHLAKHNWVLKEDVQILIEKKTNIPIRNAEATEAATLLNLEADLHKRVIGQNEAVSAVANALRRARAGLQDTTRPISSFLFVGPTGVGKTETAKALAALYFGKEDAMIRLDMSEYQDSTAIYRLIGAPAGSSQYSEGGTLTTAVRERPFSLILLDEIEKAYPDVLDLFLQMLDDGRLTENTGRLVHFTNTIIIATSNAGSSEILSLLQDGLPVGELPKRVIRMLQDHFKPEFLNRFDAVIPFHPLDQSEIEQVVGLMLNQLSKKMLAQGYTLTFDPEAVTKIAQTGFDQLYGARPLRRFIQDKVEGMLAQQMISGTLKPGQALRITAEMIQ